MIDFYVFLAVKGKAENSKSGQRIVQWLSPGDRDMQDYVLSN